MTPEVIVNEQGGITVLFSRHQEWLSLDEADKLGFELQRITRRFRSDKISEVLRREMGWPHPGVTH